MINCIPMTLQGFNQLKKELRYLKNIKRPQIISAISDARQLGDLKENAEYHAAREEQGFCENKIRIIETKLSNAQVIDIKKLPNLGVVVFGSTVTIQKISTKEIFVYKIVGDDEANFKNRSISIYSPMSRGLIGKKPNEKVNIQTPSGEIDYLILQIQYI